MPFALLLRLWQMIRPPKKPDVGREERVRAALAVAGKYADPEGLTDGGENHDRYLDESLPSLTLVAASASAS